MTNEEAKSELMQIYMSLSEEKKKALDVLMAQADGEYKSNKELLCDSCYRKIAGCQAKFHNPHPVDHCIEYKPIEKQADGEYIRRSDVIKAVDKHTIDTSEIVLDEDITVILEELPSVAIPSAESKWIPVSERLPEDGERVLVTYDKIVIRATWDLMRYSFYDTHAVGLDKDFVYAWMPLPKPYEPQERSE